MRIAISLSLLFIAAARAESHSPPENLSARSLDALLQEWAFEALSLRPKTGVVFEAEVPKSLTGIGASALRLRSGSLRARGVDKYREFRIPTGVTEQPYSKRVVLVYHNLGNLSSRFYPLPGYEYLAPVVGLIAYDASNLTAVGLPELELRASGSPIAARFGGAAALPGGAQCVFFDLHGGVQFDLPARGSHACEMLRQGHLSVVVESKAPSPAPATGDYGGRRGGGDKSRAGKIVGCLVVVVVVFVVGIGLFLFWFRGRRSAKRDKEEEERGVGGGGGGETLEMTSFGGIKAPFAKVTRTQPLLEDRYVL